MNKGYITDNGILDDAIYRYAQNPTADTLSDAAAAVRLRINENGAIYAPIEKVLESRALGDEKNTAAHRVKLVVRKGGDGCHYDIIAFTSEEEAMKSAMPFIKIELRAYIKMLLDDSKASAIIFNPMGTAMVLDRGVALMIVKSFDVMRFKTKMLISERDITKIECDCIVNAANKSLLGGGGVDGVIHRAAGKRLLEECGQLNGCETGKAKITRGYDLPAQYVIHTVGLVYSGTESSARELADCYTSSLNLAKSYGIHSIAFPAISTGVYGCPKEPAARIAVSTVKNWLSVNMSYGMTVVFSCFDKETADIYRRVLSEK